MEVQVFLAKFLGDPRRGEASNVGLIVRTADDRVLYRFLLDGGDDTQEVPKGMDLYLKEYANVVPKWTETIDKYGPKALQWVGKRKSGPGQRFFVEFAFGEMVMDFDFDKLFAELVL
jgi:hypothetical protein